MIPITSPLPFVVQPRSVEALEKAMETLTAEYESCEAVRMDTSDLQSPTCSNEETLLSQLTVYIIYLTKSI